MSSPVHVVYCRSCQRAWYSFDIPIIWLDDAARVAERTAVDDCACACTDDQELPYEDWVVDPDPADVPPGAWER